MQLRQQHRTEERLVRAAADFVSRESNRSSLVTITGHRSEDDLRKITFLVSIYPREREAEALGFLLRSRAALREHIKEHVPLRHLPHVEFALDAQPEAAGEVL